MPKSLEGRFGEQSLEKQKWLDAEQKWPYAEQNGRKQQGQERRKKKKKQQQEQQEQQQKQQGQ